MKTGILIGHMKDENNESAMVRSAEAFGINEVHIVGESKNYIESGIPAGRRNN